ncbi:unnamed protein product [Rotaria socialis]|uniref:Uncharacterized protein n=1 Tax=Rotaria socialis TaxID=392032 RepID=A0A818CWA9_9BILA|nr:unnamed protein product [Rotaria socialis]CAF3377002.1 unnamed protein product [Rotaria socialis]CAF3438806.1 unnamed protein product [Rotaria socialis]CAF3664499.1 unnamed protein product [Rotaria socialis]CAF4090010.1 unnamed protein product [Rotaria socialis]
MDGIFRRILTAIMHANCSCINRRRRSTRTTDQPTTNLFDQTQKECEIKDVAIPELSRSVTILHKRARISESSSILFGNTCLRLVNIAFHTSQTFPAMMNTCATISQYLEQELTTQWPDLHYHIVIAENSAFGFCINNGDHFAEIKQEQYCVLIFTTSSSTEIKYSKNDANANMELKWNV